MRKSLNKVHGNGFYLIQTQVGIYQHRSKMVLCSLCVDVKYVPNARPRIVLTEINDLRSGQNQTNRTMKWFMLYAYMIKKWSIFKQPWELPISQFVFWRCTQVIPNCSTSKYLPFLREICLYNSIDIFYRHSNLIYFRSMIIHLYCLLYASAWH